VPASVSALAAGRYIAVIDRIDRVTLIDVDGDRGVATGAAGRTIEVARRLAERHHDAQDIQLTQGLPSGHRRRSVVPSRAFGCR
jgi:N utilization substance protein A